MMKSYEEYQQFIDEKRHLSDQEGFEPIYIPDWLYEFQQSLCSWAIQKGRAALFADCGLGKTPMQIVWAYNVAQYTQKPVLILAPLAVSSQTVIEGEKFGFDLARSRDGSIPAQITVTNYEKIHHFNPKDFGGVVCDESSILKSFDGAIKTSITDFMRKHRYRLLATATAAPNDYIELGTSSEALGYLGAMDMLNRFFKNDNNTSSMRRMYGEAPKWRFKGHAEQPFWQWVTSWARACRYPSDLGFDDGAFRLPGMEEVCHEVQPQSNPNGMLFDLPAVRLDEQRDERKRTLNERCEKAAELVNGTNEPAVVWCHMNAEGDLLNKLIPDAEQVSGSDADDIKEAKFQRFSSGDTRVLITKPKIGAWGLNWQHCAHIVYFPSHSYEAYYQAVRRCWRFGQKQKVRVDIVMTPGEERVLENMQRKKEAADVMFKNLVAEMNHAVSIQKKENHTNTQEVPKWL